MKKIKFLLLFILSVFIGTLTACDFLGDSSNSGYDGSEGIKYEGTVLVDYADCKSINVVVDSKTTVIDVMAFKYRNSVISVTLPETLKEIRDHAFFECYSLKEIVIPNGVETIGNSAFYGCKALENVTLPQGLKVINMRTFFGCSSYAHVVLPNTVEEIKEAAFSGAGIVDIILPTSLKTIGKQAFFELKELDAIYYYGTAEDWTLVEIGKENTSITKSNLYFYSETEPTESGNYWHFDATNNPIKW